MLEPTPNVKPSNPPVSPYGYTPGMDNTIAFLVVFSLLTLVHLHLGLRYKYWSAIVTMVFGGLLEVIGWAGRLWSAKNVLLWDPFIMQTCCLILGPTFFSAWDYTLLGMCIKLLGREYSLLPPNMYLFIFLIADAISLILQAIGGGDAAVKAKNFEDHTKATTAFTALAIDFMTRVILHKPYSNSIWSVFRWKESGITRKPSDMPITPARTSGNNTPSDSIQSPLEKGDAENHIKTINSNTDIEIPPATELVNLRKVQYLLGGVAWATLMIYIRGIYRSIELTQGWEGYLITHEVYFIWLDGCVMVLCMAGLAVVHPGLMLSTSGWR